MLEAFRIYPGRRPDGHDVARARTGIAEGPFGDGGAELVEESVPHVQAVEYALRTEVAVRQDGGRAILVHNATPTILDLA